MRLKFVGKIENVEYKHLTDKQAQEKNYLVVTISDYDTRETLYLNFPKNDYQRLSNAISKCIVVNYIHLDWRDSQSMELMSILAIDNDEAFQIFEKNPLLG